MKYGDKENHGNILEFHGILSVKHTVVHVSSIYIYTKKIISTVYVYIDMNEFVNMHIPPYPSQSNWERARVCLFGAPVDAWAIFDFYSGWYAFSMHILYL